MIFSQPGTFLTAFVKSASPSQFKQFLFIADFLLLIITFFFSITAFYWLPCFRSRDYFILTFYRIHIIWILAKTLWDVCVQLIRNRRCNELGLTVLALNLQICKKKIVLTHKKTQKLVCRKLNIHIYMNLQTCDKFSALISPDMRALKWILLSTEKKLLSNMLSMYKILTVKILISYFTNTWLNPV